MTYNQYFDATTKRTQFKLYEYYLPEGLSMPAFYSPKYLGTYTDGYGYDFYYGGYGFYEYSKLPVKPALWSDDEN